MTLLAAVLMLLSGAPEVDQPTLLFAVWTHQPSPNGPLRTYVEPIGVVRVQQFGPDKFELTKPPKQKELLAEYYADGARYSVFRGGVRTGAVTILPSDNGTCQPVQRLAARTGRQPPAGWSGADAVASGSFDLARHGSNLHPPTKAETAELLGMVRRLFLVKAVPAAALERIVPRNVVAVDLDGDGRTDFIGSFRVSDSINHHNLFAVVMRDATGALRADVIRYDRTPKAKDEMLARSWSLVDVEDFNGDGVYEIIVANHFWESISYDVLTRRREGEWDVVYTGGGSGC